MPAGQTETEEMYRFIVVRYEDTWHLAPLPISDPRPITAREIIDRMHRGTPDSATSPDRAAASLSHSLSPDQLLNPAWISIAEVIKDKLVVGDANSGSAHFLDEHDVGLIDLLTVPKSSTQLAASYTLLTPDQVILRCGRLVSAGIVAVSETSDPPESLHSVADAVDEPAGQPSGAPTPTSRPPSRIAETRARVSEAYRLSSKLGPVRRLVNSLTDRFSRR